jgi:hypothetical protein
MGAIDEVWESRAELPTRLSALLQRVSESYEDTRDRAGAQRGGRRLAAAIASEVVQQAMRRD